MPLQFLEIGSHVEIHAIEWHDFERDTQFHGVVVAWIEFSQFITCKQQIMLQHIEFFPYIFESLKIYWTILHFIL